MSSWKIIDTGPASAEKNMAIDSALLHSLSREEKPILHFYEWTYPSGTYGHFIDPKQFFHEENLIKSGLSLAKRPTGGGIVFHLRDLAFSVLIPASCPECSMNTLENYAFVNNRVIQAVKSFLGQNINSLLLTEEPPSCSSSKHFCMGKPTKFDGILNGKKLCGGAQRRTKHGFLHQGTISLALPDEELMIKILKGGKTIFESMKLYTYTLIETEKELQEVRKELRVHLLQSFTSLDSL